MCILVCIGSIEEKLLSGRPTYETMLELHSLLLTPQQMSPIKSIVEEWIREMSVPFSIWIDKLVIHVLRSKFEKRAKKVGKR